MFLSKLTYYLTLFSTSSDASRICTIIICYGLVHKLIIRLFTQFQFIRGVKTGYKRVVHKQFFDNSKKLSVCALLHFFFFSGISSLYLSAVTQNVLLKSA